MREYFKKHAVVAILYAFFVNLILCELLSYLGQVLGYSTGTTNVAYFIREIIVKVLPAFFIALSVGALDSLKEPFNNLGKSLLSGIVILAISIMGSIACIKVNEQAGVMLKAPSEIVFYVLFLLMVGLSEELLMRGTITRILAEKLGTEGKGMWLTVLLGALIFGMYHIPNYKWTHDLEATLLQLIATSMLGMLLCAIYVKWGNLLGVIILHAVFDFMTMSDAGLFEGKSIADRASGAVGNLRQTLISNSIFVIAALIVMIHKKKNAEKVDRDNTKAIGSDR